MGKCDDQRPPLPCEGRSYGPRETGTGFFDAGRYLRRQWAVSQRQRERIPEPTKPRFISVNAVIFRDGGMWETEVYFELDDLWDYDTREWIAICIQNFEEIIDQEIE